MYLNVVKSEEREENKLNTQEDWKTYDADQQTIQKGGGGDHLQATKSIH